jgi:hypothetical protein
MLACRSFRMSGVLSHVCQQLGQGLSYLTVGVYFESSICFPFTHPH